MPFHIPWTKEGTKKTPNNKMHKIHLIFFNSCACRSDPHYTEFNGNLFWSPKFRSNYLYQAKLTLILCVIKSATFVFHEVWKTLHNVNRHLHLSGGFFGGGGFWTRGDKWHFNHNITSAESQLFKYPIWHQAMFLPISFLQIKKYICAHF